MNTRTVQELSAMYARYVQQSGAGYSVRHYHRSNVCCFTARIAAIARTTRELSLDGVAILSGPAAAATFVSILYSSVCFSSLLPPPRIFIGVDSLFDS